MKKTIAILMTAALIFITSSVSTFAAEKSTVPDLITCATETEDYADYETIEEYYDGEITTPDEYGEIESEEIDTTTQSIKKETNVPKMGDKRKSYSVVAALIFALTILAYCIVKDKKNKKDKNKTKK